MPISFEIPERIQQNLQMAEALARGIMRPEARALDENEHQRPETFIKMTWPVSREQQKRALDKLAARAASDAPQREGPGIRMVDMIHTFEMLSWGDVGQLLCMPTPLLAGAAPPSTSQPGVVVTPGATPTRAPGLLQQVTANWPRQWPWVVGAVLVLLLILMWLVQRGARAY